MQEEVEGEGEEDDGGDRTLRNGGAAACAVIIHCPRGHQTRLPCGEFRAYPLRGRGLRSRQPRDTVFKLGEQPT